MNKWYEEIPYGPLTKEDFERLSSSFYDSSRIDEEAVAIARGIRSGEFLGMVFHDMRAANTEVELTADEAASEYDMLIGEGLDLEATREEFLAMPTEVQKRVIGANRTRLENAADQRVIGPTWEDLKREQSQGIGYDTIADSMGD